MKKEFLIATFVALAGVALPGAAQSAVEARQMDGRPGGHRLSARTLLKDARLRHATPFAPSRGKSIEFVSRTPANLIKVGMMKAPHALNVLNEFRMNITYNSDWGEKNGAAIYSWSGIEGDPALVSPENLVGFSFLYGDMGACAIDTQGTYLVTSNAPLYGGGNDATSYVLHMSNWEPIGTISEGDQTRDGFTPYSLAYDPRSGADFYGTFYDAEGDGLHFGMMKIGLEAPGSTVIRAVTGADDCPASLGFDRAGKLYCITLSGKFGTLDCATGVISPLFDTEIYQTTSFGLAYNPADGCFYTLDQVAEPAEDYAGARTRLMKINVETQKVEEVRTLPLYLEASGFYIDQRTVKDASPAAVGNLTFDFRDTLTGRYSFTVPELTVGGEPLEGDVAYQVYVNGELLEEDAAAPGSAVRGIVMREEEGNVLLEVVVSNAAGFGPLSSVTAWAGVFIPQPARITGLEVTEDPEKDGFMTIKWDPISVDTSGKPLDISKYRYRLTAFIDGWKTEEIADTTETTFSYQAVEGDAQQFVTYTVTPYSNMCDYTKAAEESDAFCIGKAFTLPYIEDFEDEYKVNEQWLLYGFDNAKFTSIIRGVEPENGAAYLGVQATWNATETPHAEVYSGKISLKDTRDPKLTFKYFSIPGQFNSILLLVIVNGTPDVLSFIDTADGNEAGWRNASFDLARFRGENIQVSFTMDADKMTSYMAIDDIKIVDPADYDIEVSGVTVDQNLTAGLPAKVTAKVTNAGLKPVGKDSYSLSLKAQARGKELCSLVAEGVTLQAGASGDVEFTVTPDLNWGTENVITVSALYDVDEETTNNAYSVSKVICRFPFYPSPRNLNGALEGDDVSLSWEAPEKPEEETVTESFESLAPYSIADFGEWKTVDGDGLPTYGIATASGDLYFPNVNQPHAFIVFPDDLFGYNVSFEGTQHLVSIVNYVDDKADDWLISPELSGAPQTIDFYSAVMFEGYPATIEICVSDSDSEPASFRKLKTVNVTDTQWANFFCDIPDGTRYFALHVVENAYMVKLDFITYSPAVADIELKGYNVYCDGVRVTPELLIAPSFIHGGAGSGHTYAVSAVYDKGESPLSAIVLVEENSVGEAAATIVRVAGGKGCITVSGAAGSLVEVIAPDGRKMAVREGADRIVVNLPAGIYAVRVGGKSFKTVVR